VDHTSGRLIWAAVGRDKKTLGGFFDLLGPERWAQIRLVSADAAEWIGDVVAERCPDATLCIDSFHVVPWATEALDEVRRGVERGQEGRHVHPRQRAQGLPLRSMAQP
jgi:transposase